MISKAAELIKSSKYVIVFTGAGISAESGIPTFRGSDGLWHRFRAEDLATPEAFARDPKRVWEWYKWRMEIIRKARPNPAHRALARMEAAGILKAVITQNVDGLHTLAGSRNVIELHGNIWEVKCSNPACDFKSRLEEPPEEVPLKCPICGTLLRPDVVWFGEPLPPDAWEKAVREASEADLVIVVGTSGAIMPAALIPTIVKDRGGKVIEVNISESAITPIADVFIKRRASEALPKIAEALGP
ncbi:MAG: NAD-dependent protein deacylase [Thermoprotei archaeon]|nr:MAG: NAD-dependent protein deacylase [Thermoprotei archaeon]